MSSWANLEESLPPSLPEKQAKRLPDAPKLARMLRAGRTVSDLAVRYGVAGTLITQRLTSNGWDPSNGKWVGGNPKDFRRDAPLTERGEGAGQACHYVGGGDNPTVVPITSRPFTHRPKPTGFAWPAREDAPPRPKPERIPPSRNYTNQLKAANEARSKLSPEDRAEIARRYVEDLTSSVILAQDYGVNQRTIRKAIIHAGYRIRNRGEAGRIRWQNEHGGAA